MATIRPILLIGGCGSGKTWVMKKLIELFKLETLGKVGTCYFHRNDKVLVLGKYDGSTFEGTDKLSMAVMTDVPKFLEWAKSKKLLVIAEGDRFTNKNFIAIAKPIIIHIVDDGAAGRKKRKSSQTERQIKSIATRVKNIGGGATHQSSTSDTALKLIVEYITGKR